MVSCSEEEETEEKSREESEEGWGLETRLGLE